MERQLGEIKINNEVIAGIAGRAALKVEGVVGLSEGIIDGIAKLLTGGQVIKAVKVETGKEECAIDISIIVEYGAKISEVCLNVQEAIKNAIFQMTGLVCAEVNVSVEGVEESSYEKKRLK